MLGLIRAGIRRLGFWPDGFRPADPKAEQQREREAIVDETPKTAAYKGVGYHRWGLYPRDLPVFTMLTVQQMLLDPTIKLGLAMRAAPLYALEWGWKDGEIWNPGIEAKNPEVAQFVERQLKAIWANALDGILKAQVWGWSGGEICHKMTPGGLVEIEKLLPRHANDIRARTLDSKLQGIRVLRCQQDGTGYVDLDFPKAWWHAYEPEPGLFYGYSCLLGAYSPWWDKWMNGGALDVRRLFMHKDAYAGADLTYPEGMMNIPGHGEVPNRDIARQIVEEVVAGGVTTFPYQPGADGRNMWNLTRATVSSNPGHILQYPKDLDVEILRGLEIADDVLAVDGSGSWAGKRVPMAAFYAGLDRWAGAVVRDLDEQAIRPLVEINFGEGQEYTIGHKPLAEQAMEQQQAEGADKQPGAGGETPYSDLFGGQDQSAGNPPPRQPPQSGQPRPQQPQKLALRTEAEQIVAGVRRVLGVRMGTLLHGGRAEGMPDEDFDAEQLAAGIQEELEHTDDIRIAKQIAKDHLAEDPEYYRKLKAAESGQPVSMSADKENGEHWITIGGRKGEEGEHTGGFPVKLNADGEIIAGGPKGLRGKHVREVYKHFQRARNTPQAKERRYQSTVRKQARAWRISPEEYQRYADEVHKEKLGRHQAREAAKAWARKSLGVTAADINRWENQGLDYSSEKLGKYGFDTVGRELASQFPDLGWGGGYGDDSSEGGEDAKLWDLLKEGKVDAPSRNSPEFHADVDEYLQYLTGQGGGNGDDEGDTSFDFGAESEEEKALRFALGVVRLAKQSRMFTEGRPGGSKSGTGDQKRLKWITIGGASGPEGEHMGGTPVGLDGEGRVVAGGPAHLKGVHVSDIKEHFDDVRGGGEGKAEKPAETLAKPAPKYGTPAYWAAKHPEGKFPHELTPAEFMHLADPQGGKFRIGADKGPSDEYLKLVRQQIIKDPSKVPTEVLDAIAADSGLWRETSQDIKNELESRKQSAPAPQTDLLGQPVKPAAPKPDAIEDLGGKQQGLFPKKGLPGQQNLFADRGVPDEMVQKPAAAIRDVTPEGYGPTEESPGSLPTRPSDSAVYHDSDYQALRSSINEAKTVLRGKLPAGQRTQIEAQLKRKEAQLFEMERGKIAPSASDIDKPYTRPSSVDTPAQGDLNQARKTKAKAWKRVKDLRDKVKAAGPQAGNLRLELIKAESAWQEAQRREKAAAGAIENRANELGQTTRPPAENPAGNSSSPLATNPKTDILPVDAGNGPAQQQQPKAEGKGMDTQRQVDAAKKIVEKIKSRLRKRINGRGVHDQMFDRDDPEVDAHIARVEARLDAMLSDPVNVLNANDNGSLDRAAEKAAYEIEQKYRHPKGAKVKYDPAVGHWVKEPAAPTPPAADSPAAPTPEPKAEGGGMENKVARDAKFTGKGKVSIRAGGEGKHWVGKIIFVRSKDGKPYSVMLESLIQDYGHGDVAEYKVKFV